MKNTIFLFFMSITLCATAQNYTTGSDQSEINLYFELLGNIYTNTSSQTDLSRIYPIRQGQNLKLPGLGLNGKINYPNGTPADPETHNYEHEPLQDAIALMSPTHIRFPGGTLANSFNLFTTEIEFDKNPGNLTLPGPMGITETYYVDNYAPIFPSDPENPDFSLFVYNEGSFLENSFNQESWERHPDALNPIPTGDDYDDALLRYTNYFTTIEENNFRSLLRRTSSLNYEDQNPQILEDNSTIWNTREYNILRDFIDLTIQHQIDPVYVLKMYNPLEFVVELINPAASVYSECQSGFVSQLYNSPYLRHKIGNLDLCTDYSIYENHIINSSEQEVKRQLVKYLYEYFLHFDTENGTSFTVESDFNLFLNNVDESAGDDPDYAWAEFIKYINVNANKQYLSDVNFHFEFGNEFYFHDIYKFLPTDISSSCNYEDLKTQSQLICAN